MRQCASLTVLMALLLGQPAVTVGARQGVNCQRLESPLRMGDRVCVCKPCHACELDAAQLECVLAETPGQSLSDGSELPVEQPVTNTSAWFLTEEELTQSRGGVRRGDLAVFTTGNVVSAFVAPSEFFHAVFEDVRATSAGDRIFLTSWSVDNTPFEPASDPRGAISGFQNIFAHAVVRGAEFYALAHANFWEKQGNLQVRDFMNALPVSPNGGTARFLFDDRLASPGNSHHQKTLVIENRHERIAYVGGIDLTTGRWDTLAHTAEAGWMDCHVRILGPAAADVATNFLSRWNSSATPGASFTDKMRGFVNPPYEPLPAIASDADAGIEPRGQHSVQIVRTYNPQYAQLEAAPRGETSIFQARIKAIRQAKNYIYIEDQYFVLVPQLLDELLKVLPGLQRLIIVVQRPGSDESYSVYKKLLHDMAAPMQRQFPNKLQLYTTKQARNIYVHTKLVLIDDVYMSIGSANWNDCSMRSDSELNANVVDEQLVTSADGVRVGSLALDYRVRKFVELTGWRYDELLAMPLVAAANLLDAATSDPTSILDALEPEERNYTPM